MCNNKVADRCWMAGYYINEYILYIYVFIIRVKDPKTTIQYCSEFA